MEGAPARAIGPSTPSTPHRSQFVRPRLGARRRLRGQDTDKERIRAAFDKYDMDQDGLLDPSELSKVAAELGSAMDPQEFSAMLGMLECDAKGRVRYESFASFWLGEAGYSVV